jgi:hypothetical protein
MHVHGVICVEFTIESTSESLRGRKMEYDSGWALHRLIPELKHTYRVGAAVLLCECRNGLG